MPDERRGGTVRGYWAGLVFVAIGAGSLTVAAADTAKQCPASRIVDLVLSTEYDEAFALADSFAALPRSDPLFVVLKLVGIGLREMDFEVTIDTARFDQASYRATAAIDSFEARGGDSAYAAALRGYTGATHAASLARHGQYFGAVRRGLSALDELERALRLDSSLTDAYYFLGLYDWSQAELRRRLWWIMFWLPGDRERGIRRLEQCRRGGGFSSSAAALSLVDIYAAEERYGKAEQLLERLRGSYGASRFVLWSEARLREAQGAWKQAAGCYDRLAAAYENEAFGTRNALACRYRQAEMLDRAGLPTQASAVCSTLLGACDSCRDEQAREVCADAQRLARRLGTVQKHNERNGAGRPSGK